MYSTFLASFLGFREERKGFFDVIHRESCVQSKMQARLGEGFFDLISIEFN